MNCQSTIGAENDAVTERFAVLLYVRTTTLGKVSGVKGTFAHENLPPTKKYQGKNIPNEQCVKVTMYGANPCVPNLDYPTLKIGVEQKTDGW